MCLITLIQVIRNLKMQRAARGGIAILRGATWPLQQRRHHHDVVDDLLSAFVGFSGSATAGPQIQVSVSS